MAQPRDAERGERRFSGYRRATNSLALIRNSSCSLTWRSGTTLRVERHSTMAPSSAEIDVTAADRGSHHRAPRIEIAVDQQAFPELDVLAQQNLGAAVHGVVDGRGD